MNHPHDHDGQPGNLNHSRINQHNASKNQMNTDNNLFTGTMSFGSGHFTSNYINYPTGHDPDGSSSFHQEGRGGILTLPKKVKVLNILGPNPQYTLPENLKSNIPSNFL